MWNYGDNRTNYSAFALADIYQRQGRFSSAEGLLKETLQGTVAIWGLADQFTWDSVNRLARLYVDIGQITDAENQYRELIKARRQLFGLKDPRTLNAMHALSCFYGEQGWLAEAERVNTQVFQIRKIELTWTDWQTWDAAQSLAIFRTQQKPDTDVEQLYEGCRPSQTLKWLLWVDSTLEERTEISNFVLERVYLAAMLLYGPDHPKMVTSSAMFRKMFPRQQGDPIEENLVPAEQVDPEMSTGSSAHEDRSRKLLLKVLWELETEKGFTDEYTFAAAGILGEYLLEYSPSSEVFEFYDKLSKSVSTSLGWQSPQTLLAVHWLACFHDLAGEKLERSALYEKLWEATQSRGDDHAYSAAHLLAITCDDIGNYQRAKELYFYAWKGGQSKWDDWRTWHAARSLERLSLQTDTVEKIEGIYDGGLKMRVKSWGWKHFDLCAAMGSFDVYQFLPYF